MAHTSLVRAKTLAQKKSESFFAARLVQSATPETDEGTLGTATANYKLANLPENCLITGAYIMVNTAADSVTSATGSLGTAEGGTEILSAADLKATGVQGTFTGELDTGSGVELYLRLVLSGATTAVGDFTIVVEYLEYEKTTGEYTRF